MSKKARSEGNRVAMTIKANKSPYYVADVDLEDDTQDVFGTVEFVRKTLGKNPAAFILISAGIENLTVAVSVSEGIDLSAKDWLEASMGKISFTFFEEPSQTNAKTVVFIDTPFKLKDIVRSEAFSHLRKLNLLEEESEEEEFFGLD